MGRCPSMSCRNCRRSGRCVGVMEGVTRAEHEAEADEGISDLKRLEEQVDTDEERFLHSLQRFNADMTKPRHKPQRAKKRLQR